MSKNEKIQCKNCKGFYTLLMSHLKSKTDCQKAYGEEYKRMLELKDQKKKDYQEDYQKNYKKQNKIRVWQIWCHYLLKKEAKRLMWSKYVDE